METSSLASVMALPREGHLNAWLSLKSDIMVLLSLTLQSQKYMNPNSREDWSATPYGICNKEIPSNVPEPLGSEFVMRAFVDSDHAGDSITRRSRTGFIVFLNNAPVYCNSKNIGTALDTITPK